jgi:hypothetical protein
MAKPTERQLEALRGLAATSTMWPAAMGYHLAETSSNRQFAGKALKPQGAGRIGGTMLSRLVAEGWARRLSYQGGRKWSNAHEITPAGRAALANQGGK